jgi:hypothetical protein
MSDGAKKLLISRQSGEVYPAPVRLPQGTDVHRHRNRWRSTSLVHVGGLADEVGQGEHDTQFECLVALVRR